MTACLPPDDAARWREFAAMAREVFDLGDAWATEHADPEGGPTLEGAEGWATRPLRMACVKGRLALKRGDVAGVVLALIEAGHAGRKLEIVNRWLGTIEAISRERRRRAGGTLIARKADRDHELLTELAKAPASYRKTPNAAAAWLRDNGYTTMTRGQIARRLRKHWGSLEKS